MLEKLAAVLIGHGLGRYRRRRPYLTLVIPESVAMREKARLSR